MSSPRTIIEKAEEIMCVGDNRFKIGRFLEKFSECEVYVRPTLVSYFKSLGEDIGSEDIGLEAKTIRTAFSEKGIYFDDNKLITRIFGAEDSPGESSCRWLRNKITHVMMKRALNEVCNRYDSLLLDMNNFISQIEAQT